MLIWSDNTYKHKEKKIKKINNKEEKDQKGMRRVGARSRRGMGEEEGTYMSLLLSKLFYEEEK